MAEQVRGKAKTLFKAFSDGNYVTNASMFRIVQLGTLRNPRGIYLSNEKFEPKLLLKEGYYHERN